MAPPLDRGRARSAPNPRERARRLSRGARAAEAGGRMTARLDRLAASLEEPLLVTNSTNVRYLCGFESSNVALLVEQDRTRLFTDFRYAEAAKRVEGVEF